MPYVHEVLGLWATRIQTGFEQDTACSPSDLSEQHCFLASFRIDLMDPSSALQELAIQAVPIQHQSKWRNQSQSGQDTSAGQYLHSHPLGPIFHGDLKGASMLNVLVSSDRRALLSDFGLSTLQKSTFSMTEGDVWAFGMTVLELFTRLIPFHDCPHFANVMHRLESTLSRMTDAWWEICTSCWRREPSARPLMKDLIETVPFSKDVMVCPLQSLENIISSDPLLQPHLSPLRDSQPWRSTSVMLHDFLPSCWGILTRFCQLPSHLIENSIGWVRSVAFSPDGEWVVSGSYDKTVCLWGHSSKVLIVVSGSTDKTIRLWDVHVEAPSGLPLEGHTGAYGTRIVSGSHDKTKTRAQLEDALEGHTGMVYTVAFSPDGHMVVSGSEDNTLCLWDARAEIAVGHPLIGHSGAVNSVAFSPDGMWVVSGSVDTNVFLWDVRTGVQVGTALKGNAGWVRCVAFSPYGREIIAGTEDRSICLWNARVH
ncbi:WD40-repeat-containing domain protein [Pisolithus orientalis]|uniref:WD40-repeat-containing domain protein n=1 Tax=Pisolithus orientalis TaxID=936130 RepID=UPI002224CA8F|nr:WD40-repeat-containing domain protein [Pisolithus orientalis]KAI5996602.1 WD40-repeat-containing domain protein [Pisolithus orientalis]